MKTTGSGSVWLSILLLVCLSSSLCAQSIDAIPDSVKAEFLRNVRHINADLIKGDFAREREAGYLATIAAKDAQLLGQSTELAECKANVTELARNLAQTRDQLSQANRQRNRARLENWGWRAALVLGIYVKIKTL